ncbi:mobilisation protein (MobC) [Loktanella sp. DSM 29012]|uniref:plasmid mobilization protein n=1 Tax=Loktanella sp. DSM 29012 TaxID=1881056 RepID=UPI0008BB497D|nr:plasmid mobilization relaxosome protein MobC [Loktanella sp. DSM 29012]SEQ89390.1 mobilisation protein (MobC) [Loktanella sp. DSM 29012]
MMRAGDGKPRSDKRRATRVISFRVSPELEAELIEEAANDDCDSIGAWAKGLALDAIGRPASDKKVLRSLIGELGKIGSNLNQLARVANTTGRLPDEAMLRRAADATLDLQRRINRLLP